LKAGQGLGGRIGMAKIIKAILIGVLLAGLPALLACSADAGQNSQLGNPAPNFSLNDLNNNSISLSSYLGKTVFLNFWATTCPPCVDEMPHFQALYQEWSARDDVVILTVDIGEDAGTVRNFMQSKQYSFPVLLDSQLKVAEKYRIQYTPTSLVIDKEGLLQYRVIGAFKDKPAVVKAVEGVLKR
jgi:peroxiredoxin